MVAKNRQASGHYPDWIFYPVRSRPPEWVRPFLDVVISARPNIDSEKVSGLTSNAVLKHLEVGLKALKYSVEADKKASNKIRRPVLFGPQGREVTAYEVDAMHDDLGVVVEVEAGRGARGNAIYRDLIRTSLIVDAKFLALGVMRSYRHQSSGKSVTVQSFDETRKVLDAVYASGRLQLPFDGVLLFGY